MSKKNKRQVSTTTRETLETGVKAAASPVRMASSDFNPDYSYVITDLKKIAILAVIFIAGLVVLSFIL